MSKSVSLADQQTASRRIREFAAVGDLVANQRRSTGFDMDVDPYATFRAMRARGPLLPVDLHEELGIDASIWVTSAATGYARHDGPVFSAVGYDACWDVLRNTGDFGQAAQRIAQRPFLGDAVLSSLEGAEHRRYRDIVQRAFAPKAVRMYAEEFIRPLARDGLDRLLRERDGAADLIDDFIGLYPGRVIAALMGVHDDDLEPFMSVATAMIDYGNVERATEASELMYAWGWHHVAERRDLPPGRDLFSQLAHADVDGQRLTDDEIASFVRFLFTAGFETTTKSLANLLVGLLTSGDWPALRADPDLVGVAVEEGLRWQTPVLGVPRIAVRDTEADGIAIPKGSVVQCFLASANRDERRWADPEVFDLGRDRKSPAAFGFGPHACLGLHLARMEMAIALETMLEMLPGLALRPGAEEEVRIRGLAFRGPAALPVTY